MLDSPTSEPESDFVCDCEEGLREACVGEPFYGELEDKQYCVLHFPGNDKSADFEQALQRKLESEDFDFRGVWFPDKLSFDGFAFGKSADFRFVTFSAKASFDRARFTQAADFRDAIFGGEANFFKTTFARYAYFTRTRFNGEAVFTNAVFDSRVFFNHAHFGQRMYFTSASFGERAYFMQTTFCNEAHFNYASFQSYVLFSGGVKFVFRDETSLDFQFTRFEEPERVSFHTLTLRPHWFANLDTRKLNFVNVNWQKTSIDKEIRELKRTQVLLHSSLAIIFRHLAVNAEDNHRYVEASRFRYLAMDVMRRERWRGLSFWRLSWWYWVASGYGERVSQAFLVLLGIWLVSGFLYTQVGFARWEPKLANESDVAVAKRDDSGAPLRFSRALTYSAGVVTLQKPEPRPASTAAQTFVLLETILGPVQAALLALAIRRKFML